MNANKFCYENQGELNAFNDQDHLIQYFCSKDPENSDPENWKLNPKIQNLKKRFKIVSIFIKGWKFLKKLWCCVGGVIWLYQLSWKCKLATVTSLWRRADARKVSFWVVTVVNLHFQLSWYNQINFYYLYGHAIINYRAIPFFLFIVECVFGSVGRKRKKK